MYGFDDYVDLIAYPYGEFGDSKTAIYRILFGEIFYVPAEWQVLMRFGPQAHNEGSSFQDVTYESAKLKNRFNCGDSKTAIYRILFGEIHYVPAE